MTHPHHHEHHRKDTGPVRAAVITVSDTRTLDDDHGGRLVVELLESEGHAVGSRAIVRDDRAAIDEALTRGLAFELIVLTGGTGIAPRDVTYEVVAARLEKTLDGFGEAFRRLSWDEIGPRAILSRAVCGTIGKTMVVALPGSTKGVELGMRKVLLPIVKHVVGLLR